MLCVLHISNRCMMQSCLTQVEHSPYNGMAYCERFPRGFDPNDPGNEGSLPLYWAQVRERLHACVQRTSVFRESCPC
eukprot:scaffold40860_cov18-Tisochrysis_lutea.AAC.1